MYDEDNSDILYRIGLLFAELALMNLLLLGFLHFEWLTPVGDYSCGEVLLLFSLCYVTSNLSSGTVTHHRLVRGDQILRHVLSCVLSFTLLSCALSFILHIHLRPYLMLASYYVLLSLCIMFGHKGYRLCIKAWRRRHPRHRVLFVGTSEKAHGLLKFMLREASAGYIVAGYFDDAENPELAGRVPYLGTPADVDAWIGSHPGEADQLFCTLSHTRPESADVLRSCENHLVRFFVVPGVRDYIHHRMHFTLMNGVPVLSLRYEPLNRPLSKLLKRAFDIVVSSLFLCTLFPLILLVFGVAIKLSSPGPIFFKQKRSGQNGKEFLCYKFRSMKVNAQADTLQATKNDPRKTRLGEFMRRTNIDELPQFINVLRGEMSVVGPRPHMLKHTEEYSRLIDKYMVRHFAKPGITGWAQVSGYRGETKELWQMEGRVERDIWYIEHWTFALDLYIMYRTLLNAIGGEKEAY